MQGLFFALGIFFILDSYHLIDKWWVWALIITYFITIFIGRLFIIYVKAFFTKNSDSTEIKETLDPDKLQQIREQALEMSKAKYGGGGK
jgi:hypothetical protein